MFFGLATLLLMVIVDELTASAGGVAGLGLEPVPLELEPHATIAHAAAAAHASARRWRVVIRISPIRPEKRAGVTSNQYVPGGVVGGGGSVAVLMLPNIVVG